MKPETALDLWRSWSCSLNARPVIVDELTGGKTNRSFLLNAGGDQLIMRLDTPSDNLPGVDRAREVQICLAAAHAGLAPRVLHADHEAGVLITEHIDGLKLGDTDTDDMLLDRLVDLLSRVHRLDVVAHTINYADHVENFWHLIEARGRAEIDSLLKQRVTMHTLVNEFLSADHVVGLCHHDPVQANIIDRNGQLYLLDWEYAARGPVVMDYAALCVEWSIDDAEIARRIDVNPELLESAQTIYRYICALWAAVRPEND